MPVNTRVLRFGIFEFELIAGELRKNGVRVKLERQPGRVLALLLERAGELVTPEEIRQVVWPDGTTVEFEQSIKTAIRKIRDAVDDDASAPRFVETLPRRGYRFIAPVEGRAPVPTAPAPRLQAKSIGQSRALLAIMLAACFAIAGYLLWIRPVQPPRVVTYARISHDGFEKTRPCPFLPLQARLVSDVSRLYFMDWRGTDPRVAQMAIEGGQTAQLDAPPLQHLQLFDISPNGAQLLVGNCETPGVQSLALWVVPLPAGSARRLPGAEGHDASWLPDGAHVVYARGSDLWIVRSDGTDARKIVTVPGLAYWPRISPDGTSIRFTRVERTTNISSLWQVDLSGADMHAVLPGWNGAPAECCGEWTPDGRYFIFQSVRDGRADIWARREAPALMRRNKREPVRLTAGPLSFKSPRPGSDGKTIYVVGDQQRGDLVRYDATTRQVVPFLSGISADQLDFARDGQQIAYIAFPDQTLWRSRADGSEPVQLTFAPLRASHPRWSLDGTRIAFVGSRPNGAPHVCSVRPQGGPVEDLLATPSADPDWSPDAEWLMYHDLTAGSTAAGGSLRRLSLRTGQTSSFGPPVQLSASRWSPDGRQVAALQDRATHLVVLDPATSVIRTLASGLLLGRPVWSSDSRYIYCWRVPPNGRPAISRVRVRDGRTDEVMDLSHFRAARNGAWLGLSPEDSPLLLHAADSQEIYALQCDFP